MGYAHIDNLYRPEAQGILMFREVFAMEKVHGTSAHVAFRDGGLHLSPGGESAVKFAALFDAEALKAKFEAAGHPSVTVYGEAYGGKCQAQAWRYGPNLKFVAFDVQIGDMWLTVPEAEAFVLGLGLEFVPYTRVSTDLDVLNAARDAPSQQAKRNGVAGDHPMEGVVLRPILGFRDQYGHRICAKHKRDEERETATPRSVVDPGKLAVLTEATAIANEWVTPTRLQHVLDKLPADISVRDTPKVIAAMQEDVAREGAGEFTPSKEAMQAIGKRAAKLFQDHLKGAFK